MNGTLAIKIILCMPTHNDEATKHLALGLKFKIGTEIKNSKNFHPSQPVDQTINFDLKDVTGDDEVLIEAHIDPKKKHEKQAAAHWKVPLSKLLTATWTDLHLSKADGYKIDLETQWTPKTIAHTPVDEGAAHAADQIKETAKTADPVRSPPQTLAPMASTDGVIVNLLEEINQHLQGMNNRLENVESRLQAMEDRLDRFRNQGDDVLGDVPPAGNTSTDVQRPEPSDDWLGMYYAVRVKVGDQMQQTKSHGKGQESRMEQDLTFELDGADGRESVMVDVLDDHDSVLCSEEIAILGDFIEGRKGERFALRGGDRTAHVVLTSKWQQHVKP